MFQGRTPVLSGAGRATPSKTGTVVGVVTVTYSGSSFSPQVLKLTGTGQ
jgi:hypothetical protein